MGGIVHKLRHAKNHLFDFPPLLHKPSIQARSPERGIGGFVPPFHPKILQFARVFEKKA